MPPEQQAPQQSSQPSEQALAMPSLLGREAETSWSWSERDVMLYALAVGAGQRDPGAELELTTESSEGAPLRAIPTFGVLMTHAVGERVLEGLAETAVVHAEHALRMRAPLPLHGEVRAHARIEGVYDKGSGALVEIGAEAVDNAGGEPLLQTRSAVFVRGAGGFGGERGPSSSWSAPERDPDHLLVAEVRGDQALLYRLCGDRNPLHSDPAFAARAGFPRPILHGLASYGIAGRLLFNELCGADPSRFASIEARFSAPVLPPASLEVSAWRDGTEIRFQVRDGEGAVVLDRGRMELVA
ncbi:MAG: MaoC/PaaZ C-terminal domain-containing protein [Solirubrobacteraceae bacterium]